VSLILNLLECRIKPFDVQSTQKRFLSISARVIDLKNSDRKILPKSMFFNT